MDASNAIPCCGLRLRDLTYSNIKNFVVDKMHANRAFSDLQVLEPQTACELVQAIINKADVVFLWLTLWSDHFSTALEIVTRC
jgi:hypothetical protein